MDTSIPPLAALKQEGCTMTYNEYVKTYEAMLSIYLDGYKPTNIPSEVKAMVAAADKLVDFEETHPAHAAKYEAQF
jgi:hypothetical protein